MRGFVKICAVALVAVTLVAGSAIAEEITIDTDHMPSDLIAQVLEAKKQIPDAPAVTPESVAEWAQIGEYVGKALASAAREMSVEVNSFATTFVGKLTIILIVWKVIGADLWSIVGGGLFWATLSSILLWSYRRHHFLVPITSEADGKKEVEYRTVVSFDDESGRVVSMWVHVFLFALFTIVSAFIIFG